MAGILGRWAAAAIGSAAFAITRPITVSECMPYNGPGPRNANELPKRKRKKDRKKQECIPMMMALLACYKENNYGRGKCGAEEEALTACAAQQAELERTKDTTRYHLMRLVRQMRRI